MIDFRNSPVLKWVGASLGGGAGAAIALEAVDALRTRPELLEKLVNGGGLWFAALAIGMVMFRKQFESFASMQERHVIAQEQLAMNVGALVNKDDQRQREQELTLNHLARQSDKILEEIQILKAEPRKDAKTEAA